jgi:TrmH family RNA methyltransferase
LIQIIKSALFGNFNNVEWVEIFVITSTQNSKVKYVRALQTKGRIRREENAFIVEGVRLVEEALKADWDARFIFFEKELNQRGQAILTEYSNRGVELLAVTPQVMRAAAETQNPQGLLAVLFIKELLFPESVDFIFIPDTVRDPGNMGAMLRTASAAGVQAVFVPPETVDIFSPKVVRSAMGAHFSLPMMRLTWSEIGERLVKSNLRIYLTDATEGMQYNQADFQQPTAIIVGGEAEGASAAAKQVAQARLRIPMPGGAESLNAAVATGVILFEVVRQRSTI